MLINIQWNLEDENNLRPSNFVHVVSDIFEIA